MPDPMTTDDVFGGGENVGLGQADNLPLFAFRQAKRFGIDKLDPSIGTIDDGEFCFSGDAESDEFRHGTPRKLTRTMLVKVTAVRQLRFAHIVKID